MWRKEIGGDTERHINTAVHCGESLRVAVEKWLAVDCDKE